MRHPRITAAAIAVAIAATVGVALASIAGSSTPSHAAAGGQATVHTAVATVGGMADTVLVDASGLPLYTYLPDTASKSLVSGQLAAIWPPLRTPSPTGIGVSGRLTTLRTTNGNQVAYNGHFLYNFVQDRAGQVTGQGVQGFYVAIPGLRTAMPAGTSRSTDTSGYGY